MNFQPTPGIQRFLLLVISTWSLCLPAQTPPYSGTIFIEDEIITSADPTVFVSSTANGQGMRNVFDRRTGSFNSINAWLFDIVWSDGLTTEAQINPEFTMSEAAIEAEKYGRLVGQLPYCLRVDVDALWIHKGINPFGGGNRSILIHTGQTTLYENEGILEETLVHEATHTSLDAAHGGAAGWLAAQTADNNFISTYARDNPTREDVAETFLLWLAVRHRKATISTENYDLVLAAIPNRLSYLDNIVCDLSPLPAAQPVSLLSPNGAVITSLSVYPNPTNGLVNISGMNEGRVCLYDLTGREVLRTQLALQGELDLRTLVPGVYTLMVTDGNQLGRQQVVVAR